MKINKKDRLNEYFNDIQSEAIYQALKKNKYKGIKRYEISHLLKNYNINQVYSYLKTRYKKFNFLILYLSSFILFSLVFVGIASYNIYYLGEYTLSNYIYFKPIKNYLIKDYINAGILIIISINLLLFFYEILIKLFNYRLANKIKKN